MFKKITTFLQSLSLGAIDGTDQLIHLQEGLDQMKKIISQNEEIIKRLQSIERNLNSPKKPIDIRAKL